MKIKISPKMWEQIGIKAGWIKKNTKIAQVNPSALNDKVITKKVLDIAQKYNLAKPTNPSVEAPTGRSSPQDMQDHLQQVDISLAMKDAYKAGFEDGRKSVASFSNSVQNSIQ